MNKIINFSLALMIILNFAWLSAQAEGLLPNESSKPANCPAGTSNCGGYTLNDMVSTAVIVANFILSIVGSLALLAFVAGGLMMMLSGGNAEWVTRGRQTLIGAVIGLVIVFASYTIIQLVFNALGITSAAGGKWSVINWFK